MKANVGNTDRIIRFVLAAVFAVLYFTGTVGGTLGLVLLILGVVFLVTGLVRTCPIWALLKINTKGK